MERHADHGGDRALRRDGRTDGGPGRAGRSLRQRRHVVVREADAGRARLHPRTAGRHGRGRRAAAREAAVAGRVRERLRLARGRDRQALRRGRQRREGADGRDPAGVRRPDGRRVRLRCIRVPRAGTASNPWAAPPSVRLRADDRAPSLPREPWVHVLHRLRRQSRLHARGYRRAVRDPAGARRRKLERPSLYRRRARRLGRVPRRAGRVRRRAGQAGTDLEPYRTPSGRGRWELERRCAHAPVRRWEGTARTPAPRPPRRPGARVRLREGRGDRARAGEERGLDGREHEGRLGDGLRTDADADAEAGTA